jgi:hypothetical protein
MALSSINNLLTGAVKRANIGRQLQASYIVAIANDKLSLLLPAEGQQDAKAESYLKGVLAVGAVSGVVCQFLKEQEAQYLKSLNEKLGDGVVTAVSYRVSKPRNL